MHLTMQMMQPSRIIIVLYFALVISVSGYLDYDMIEGYFKRKFINYATIIGCFSRKEQLSMAKSFAAKPMTSVLNLNKIVTERFLESSHHLGIVLDGDCKQAQTFLQAIGKQGYFGEKHHWLILASKRNFTHMFRDVEMYVNADIEIVYPEENSSFTKTYTVQEVYNPSYSRGGSVKFRRIGFYNAVHGYNVGQMHNKYFLRRDMTGVHLKTMIVLPVPFKGKLLDYLASIEDRNINTFDRYNYNLRSLCQSVYNFTKDVSHTKSYGYKQKDGLFDGLVQALVRKEVDYGSTSMFVNEGRSKMIQYGRKTWWLRSAFIFRNPKSLASLEGFFKPLSVSVWVLTVVSALLLMMILRQSCVYEGRIVHRHADVTWSYFGINIVGALCQQDMTVAPKFISGRITMLFLFLFTLLIYQFYSASLVSSLLMEPPTTIKSLEDLMCSTIKAGSENTSYNREYFMNATDKSVKKFYLKKLLGPNNSSNFLSPQKGLELVQKGEYAFHVELDVGYFIIKNIFKEKTICELRQFKLNRQQSLHATFQKNSPYKEMFDSCFQHLAEVGIMSKEIKFWLTPKPECIYSKTGTFNIGLDEFYPALMLLGLGIICSLMVLLFEVLSFYRKSSRERKQKEILVYPFVN